MTIKELHDLTHHNTKIYIAGGDFVVELNRVNILELYAYGRYQVAQIDPTDPGQLLVSVKMIPATE